MKSEEPSIDVNFEKLNRSYQNRNVIFYKIEFRLFLLDSITIEISNEA